MEKFFKVVAQSPSTQVPNKEGTGQTARCTIVLQALGGQVRGLSGGYPVWQHCPVQVRTGRHGIGKTALPGARAQRGMVPGRVCKGDNDDIKLKSQNGKVF